MPPRTDRPARGPAAPRSARLRRAGAAGLSLAVAACVAPGPTLATTVALRCTIPSTTDQALGAQACREMTEALAQAYPDLTFVADGSATLPAVEIRLHHATAIGLGLSLAWTGPDGQHQDGPVQSVSVPDGSAEASRRAALYRRVIAAQPLPF